MSKKYFFISGLPRSGSTLLGAILKQNPSFHAGMTSPVGMLFEGFISSVSAGSEFANIVNVEQRKRLLSGIFDSYYADKEEEIIFDTNRMWTSHLHALNQLFPQSKMICTVRDTAWIMDSLERQYRNNAFENTRLFGNASERSTVYTRIDALTKSDRLVGFAYNSLKEAFYSEQAEKMLIVDYEILTKIPDKVFPLIYKFIEEPEFEHDFDNVEYDAPEFDVQLGLMGLHKIHPKVEFKPRKSILPPDLFQKYSNQNFWKDTSASIANVLVVK
ncbi:sulfotransferase [Candidatus Magnetomoraceae bacterium gMMP-15]